MVKSGHWWVDEVKLPGQGLRLRKEAQREYLYTAMVEYFGSKEKAAEKYLDWTAYNIRGSWVEDTPEISKEMLEVYIAFIYTIDKCDIEIINLHAEIDEDEEEVIEWDFITDEE